MPKPWTGLSTAGNHREFCRRQHRILAAYLAVVAWRIGAEFVVVPRNYLERFLLLERFRRARIDWLLEDCQPWFPHFQKLHASKTPKEFSSLYLSRKPFTHVYFEKSMLDKDRIRKIGDSGLIGILMPESPSVNPGELAAIRELTEIAVGLSDLSHFANR